MKLIFHVSDIKLFSHEVLPQKLAAPVTIFTFPGAAGAAADGAPGAMGAMPGAMVISQGVGSIEVLTQKTWGNVGTEVCMGLLNINLYVQVFFHITTHTQSLSLSLSVFLYKFACQTNNKLSF